MFASTSMIMDAAALALTAMSPTKTCKVRVSSTRYRNDPYRARTTAFINPMTPVFRGKASHTTANVPAAMKLLAATRPPSPVKPAAKPLAASSAAPSANDAKRLPHFALIGFKHDAAMYQAPFRVSTGDVVIVEADRGYHVGVVQSITTTKPTYNVPSRILRRATAAEAASVDDLTMKEQAAAASIQKSAESVGLGIRVIDVEFQLDMNKLTVFFGSKCFVDFRKLQRALFREYRCRIWLVNWNEVNHYTPVPVNMPLA